MEVGNNKRVLCATDNADYKRRSGKPDGVSETEKKNFKSRSVFKV